MWELVVERNNFQESYWKEEKYIRSIASLNLVNGSVTGLWFTNEGDVWIEEGWCQKMK